MHDLNTYDELNKPQEEMAFGQASCQRLSPRSGLDSAGVAKLGDSGLSEGGLGVGLRGWSRNGD